MSNTVIGIDLGTTNCCVSVYSNSQLKVLENKEGGRTTPSYVYVTDQNGVIVGLYAKRMADTKPEYGIYEIKRLIGRQYDDPYVKNNLNYLPFEVKNFQNEPLICVQTKSMLLKKTPKELCTCILSKLKKDVEEKLGEEIDKAVITVPAYFNIAQREATLEAATKAGFTVFKLLNEPTAAALSHFYQKKSDCNFSLVYDLGGGTFDVAILKRNGDDIDIIGVDGDSHLGGHDFDNLLVEFTCKILIDKYQYNPKSNRRNMRRLHNECEEAKKILSFCEDTSIILNAFVHDPPVIEVKITRQRFEEMCAKYFRQTIEIMERCLSKAQLAKNDIEQVILSGGSTRIPKIQTMIEDFFEGRPISRFVNPDECVAEGAAIQAALLSKDPAQVINSIKVTDVTALSLGISNFVNAVTFLIKRNTPIPASNTVSRVTVYDKQVTMSFDIYEGERLDATKNHRLGVLEISGLTPAPPGQCTVGVTMTIDQSGILKVTAQETVSGITKHLKIAYTRGSRSEAEVQRAVGEARENVEEDERFEEFATVNGYVIKYCVRSMYNMEKKGLTRSHAVFYKMCGDVLEEAKKLRVVEMEKARKLRDMVCEEMGTIVRSFGFENMP